MSTNTKENKAKLDANIKSYLVESAIYPALILNRNREVQAISDAARSLLVELDRAPLRDLINKVEQSQTPILQTLSFDVKSGTVYYDISIMPFEDGFLIQAKDCSLEHNLRAALMDSRQRFKDLVDISSDFAWEVGIDGYFVFVSQKGAVGYEPEELINKHCEDIVLRRDYKKSVNPFLTKSKMEREEVWVIRADGEPACLSVTCLPLYDENNNWVGARGVCRDITDERERDAALARAYHRDQLLAYIVKTIRDEVKPENMLSAAANATARALSANGCQIYRKKPDTNMIVNSTFGDVPDEVSDLFEQLESLGENMVGAIETKGWIGVFCATRYRKEINGAICLWREMVRGKWSDDDKILVVDVANQLGIANEQISGHERIVELSRTDALTGLLNRRAFLEEELPRHIERLRYNKKSAALIYVDLDHFKQINDTFGHQKGDEVLLLIRDFLILQIRPGDVVARLGGDEFAIWLDNISSETAHFRCERLMEESQKLKEHSAHNDKPLGLSVGLAVFDPETDETIEQLINRADGAMYLAKKGGRGHFQTAEPYKSEE